MPTPLPVAVPDPAPLPTLPAPSARTSDGVLFDVARPDAAGRVTARALLRALGWTPGLKAALQSVATALAALTGQPHPLAVEQRGCPRPPT